MSPTIMLIIYGFSNVIIGIFSGFSYVFLALVMLFAYRPQIRSGRILIIALIFLFIVLISSLISWDGRDYFLFFRIIFLTYALYFAYCIGNSNNYNIDSLAKTLYYLGFASGTYASIQILVGYNFIDIFFINHVSGLSDEIFDFDIRRGLGFYFDPLSQSTALGLGLHSKIYLNKKNSAPLFNTVFFVFVFVIFEALTLSRAGMVGLLLSFLIYINFKLVNIIKLLSSIVLLVLIIFLLNLVFELQINQDFIDSIISLGQIINIDSDVSSRFDAAGSFGIRVEGIYLVLSSLFSTVGLEILAPKYSVRDLGYFAIPLIYGKLAFFSYVTVLILFVCIVLANIKCYKIQEIYFTAIIIFILASSLVTFQLDSVYVSSLLFFFFGLGNRIKKSDVYQLI